MNINNINLDELVLGNIYINDDPIIGENVRPIVAGYIGNYVDPNTNDSYYLFMTRNRQIIHIPTFANPQLRPLAPRRQQSPDPNSRRSLRKKRNLEQQQQQQQQSNVISPRPHNRVVGGAKTKRRRRH